MLLFKKQTLESLMYGAPKVYSTERANLSGKRTEQSDAAMHPSFHTL